MNPNVIHELIPGHLNKMFKSLEQLFVSRFIMVECLPAPVPPGFLRMGCPHPAIRLLFQWTDAKLKPRSFIAEMCLDNEATFKQVVHNTFMTVENMIIMDNWAARPDYNDIKLLEGCLQLTTKGEDS